MPYIYAEMHIFIPFSKKPENAYPMPYQYSEFSDILPIFRNCH